MTKTEIRTEYIQKRKALSDDLYFGLSQKIADQFFFHFHKKLLNTCTLSIFLPIEEKKEPNTNFILKILFDRFNKLQVVVPATNIETNEMFQYCIDEQTHFEKNKYGIPEPINASQIPDNEIDMVIVPLLAFDTNGNRIGYGGGFYDKFLSKTRPDCLKIGLSFFDATETLIESEPTDIPLNYCITPYKIWDFSFQNDKNQQF